MDETSVKDSPAVATGTCLVKLFVGTPLTKELALHLSQNPEWKQASSLGGNSEGKLQQTRFQDRDYMGIFVEGDASSIEAIRDLEAKASQELEAYCPELDVKSFEFCIFPQVFLS